MPVSCTAPCFCLGGELVYTEIQSIQAVCPQALSRTLSTLRVALQQVDDSIEMTPQANGHLDGPPLPDGMDFHLEDDIVPPTTGLENSALRAMLTI